MPTGTYTTPDELYLPARKERGWQAKVNENFQTLQDIITALRATGSAINDVRAFGADPTGVADATSAFSDFFDVLNAAPNQAGYIGPGTYSVLPDVLGGVRDDCTLFGSGPASKIVASAAGTAMLDFRNGSTGVQGLRLDSFMIDCNALVPDAVLIDQISASPRLNIVGDLTVVKYLRHAIDAGLNGNSQAVHVVGGDFRGSTMTSGPDAEQAALYFRASDCVAEVRQIVRNRLAGILIEGSATVRGGHIFAHSETFTDGSQPTCILIRRGGLHEIEGVYGDNAFQNAFIVVAADANIDRVSIRGGKYTQAVQQRDTGGSTVAATYPLFLCDDSAHRVAGVTIQGVLGRASSASHFTEIVDWSADTAASSICDGNLVQACDDFYTNAPPDVGNNIITDDTSSTTPSSSRVAGAQRTRSIWQQAFSMGLDSAPTKSTLGTVPDALTRVQLGDAATTGILASMALPEDAVPGGAISIRLLWSPSTTESGTSAQWSVDALAIASGISVQASGTTTAFTGDDGAKSAGHPVWEDSTEILASADPGDVVRIDVRRLGADGADTFAGVANLVGCWVDYTATS